MQAPDDQAQPLRQHVAMTNVLLGELVALGVNNQSEIQALMDNEQTLDEDRIEQLLETLVDYWTNKPASMTYRDWWLRQLGCVVESTDDDGAAGEGAPAQVCLPATEKELKERGKEKLEQIYKMEFILRAQGDFTYTDVTREKLARGYIGFKCAYEGIEREIMAKVTFDEHMFSNSSLPKHISQFSMGYMYNLEKHNDQQQLILYFLEKLMSLGYRRIGTECYEEIKVNGIGTHAWKPVCSIEQFVYKHIEKDHNYDMWLMATKNMALIQKSIDFIQKCEDQDFAPLEPERTLFAFRNGQLDIEQDRFHEATAGTLPYHRVALKYFDCDYDQDLLDGTAWQDIPTVKFDKIFKHQGFTEDTMRLVYQMIGRLLYNVGEHDDFQVCLFFKGVAGCGKSTVAQIIQDWFPAKFVSTISANMEDKFGLAGIYNTYLCVCSEVTKKFPLDRGVWQSMVTGESVTVPRKYGDAFDGPWKVPLAMFGNECPQYEDKSGSVIRRMATFSMRRTVDPKDMDSTLLTTLRQNVAPLLVKCNRAYRELAREYGTKSFWSPGVASDQLHEWYKEVLRDIDSLSAFLDSLCVSIGPAKFVPEQDFKAAYKRYIEDNGGRFGPKDWAPDHYKAVFDKRGLQMQCKALNYRGACKHQMYILGVDVNDGDDSVVADASQEESPSPNATDDAEDQGDMAMDYTGDGFL
jgi:phage/plasmid-associated DNA primase